MNDVQVRLLAILERHPGVHVLGPDLARCVGISPRNLRDQVRSLRYDHGRWDILAKPGDKVLEHGYWISTDPAEIQANREYHERQGRDHLSRASHMAARRSPIVDETTGQNLMEFVA